MKELKQNIVLIAFAYQYQGDLRKMVNAINQYQEIDHGLIDQVETLIAQKLIQAVTIADPNYPAALKMIDNPPLVIFYQGDLKLLNNDPVLIVGNGDIIENDLENLKNQTVVVFDEQAENEPWIKQLQGQKNPIIKVVNEIKSEQQADLILTTEPPKVKFKNFKMRDCDRQTSDLKQMDRLHLALGLSKQGWIMLDQFNLSWLQALDPLTSYQKKAIFKVEEWKVGKSPKITKKTIFN